MGLYDAFKDVLNIAQKADNVELYRQLVDLSSQALELQVENTRLKEEISSLKKNKNIEEKKERHQQPYLTLSNDTNNLKYCGLCWDRDRKLIQMKELSEWDANNKKLYCHNCQQSCRLDKK